MTKITPCLWFDGNAEDAVDFYLSIFPEGRIIDTMAGPNGKPLTLTFHLLGQDFIALNGGPHYSFTPAVSFFVGCDTQAEVDTLWAKLVEGGSAQRGGWLTDKFGLSWQIVPRNLGKLLQNDDAGKASRTMRAMVKMKKLDIADLERASDGD